jgi:PAS domain-containing protein
MKAMTSHLRGQVNVYEAEYRIQAKDGTYRWYYDRGKSLNMIKTGSRYFLRASFLTSPTGNSCNKNWKIKTKFWKK